MAQCRRKNRSCRKLGRSYDGNGKRKPQHWRKCCRIKTASKSVPNSRRSDLASGRIVTAWPLLRLWQGAKQGAWPRQPSEQEHGCEPFTRRRRCWRRDSVKKDMKEKGDGADGTLRCERGKGMREYDAKEWFRTLIRQKTALFYDENSAFNSLLNSEPIFWHPIRPFRRMREHRSDDV